MKVPRHFEENTGGPLSNRSAGQRYGFLGIWSAFIVWPIVDAATHPAGLEHKLLAVVGATGFVAAYVCLVLTWRSSEWGKGRTRLPLLGVMMALASVLTLADRSGWGYLFIYSAVCSALLWNTSISFAWLILSAAMAAVVPAIGGANAGACISFASSAAGVGLLMMLVRDLRLRNEELTVARAELARTAVSAERERFARDLHDLLGHTLSVIALKAELAGRLLPTEPARAADEVADIESVARTALGEVREAVSGYRQPTLEGELAGARMALAAAGIEADVRRVQTRLNDDVEAVLAWAVREGATNVIRHSAAHYCLLEVKAARGEASVEVVDDGSFDGGVDGGDGGGHGLSGLRERVGALKGTVTAGPQAGGGYRLAVSVPSADPGP